MIKIQEIGKNGKDDYFVIYEVNEKIYSFYGSSKDVLEDLFKTTKNKNDKQNIL